MLNAIQKHGPVQRGFGHILSHSVSTNMSEVESRQFDAGTLLFMNPPKTRVENCGRELWQMGYAPHTTLPHICPNVERLVNYH